MLAGHQQYRAETLPMKNAGLRLYLFEAQGDSRDIVVPGKPAILAYVYAFVGKVERGKHPHGLAKMLLGRLLGKLAERLKISFSSGREEGCEVVKRTGSALLENAFDRLA